MSDLLEGLNSPQRQAVEHTEGPLLLLAGAGSGKTRVLTHRIAYLVETGKAAPWEILAITFTNKAANEMKERVARLVGEETAKGMWVQTFHSACLRILRSHIELLGYKKGFSIYDETDRKSMLKKAIADAGLDDSIFQPRVVGNKISEAKYKLIDTEHFVEKFGNDYQTKQQGRIYEKYQKMLLENNAVDFDDIITLTVRLFTEHPEVLEKYTEKFRYILVDEYQDTNHAQYRLVRLLSQKRRNICVVGDDDQSIYGFRGTDIRNILDFEEDYPDATVLRLEQNYRSTEIILEAANTVIANNTERKGKKLWTQIKGGDPISLYCAKNEYDEAEYLVKQINLHLATKDYKDVAVLFRTNAQSRAIEDVFRRNAVPYRLLSGLRFFDRKEIKDIMAYLRLIINPADDLSFARVVNEPKRGIGKTSMEKLEGFAFEDGGSLCDAVRRHAAELGSAGTKFAAFVQMIDDMREKCMTMTASEAIRTVMVESGYQRALEDSNEPEAEGRLENLGEFLSGAVDYEKNEGETDLATYMDGISLVADIDNYDEDQNSVVMMTIHAAKGLEFPVVFMVGLEQGLFPKSMDDPVEREEERRLCYVAITRAREKLHITYASQRTVYGKTEYRKPSVFISELPKDNLKESSTKSYATAKSYAEPQKQERAWNTNSLFEAPKPRPTVSRQTVDYQPGMRVRHAKFGNGMILTVQAVGGDARLEIAFDSVGTKNLMAVYAKLEIL